MVWLKRNFLWIFYFSFVGLAIIFHKGEPLFFTDGPYAIGKPIVWLIFLGFLAYSIYCSSKDSFIKALPRINKEIWVRQIGLDLYIGVAMAAFLIYLNEGSLLFVALWFLPILVFANLAVLLYVALNYGSIVAHFTG
ncbi:MAG: hypothetical protein DHS20C05_12140 [Hyphococcus sp.]|nr:MAG: hypothetical protein DHS20C05_12140 [Marinicaulis sp.]